MPLDLQFYAGAALTMALFSILSVAMEKESCLQLIAYFSHIEAPMNSHVPPKTLTRRKQKRVPPSNDDVPYRCGPAVIDDFCPHFPPELQPLFGLRPLLPGDSAAEYDALVRHLVEGIAPNHVLIWAEVWKIAISTWELARLHSVSIEVRMMARIRRLAEEIARERQKGSARRLRPTAADYEKATQIVTSAPPPGSRPEFLQPGFDDGRRANARAHLDVLAELEKIDQLEVSQEKRLVDARRALLEIEHAMHHTRILRNPGIEIAAD